MPLKPIKRWPSILIFVLMQIAWITMVTVWIIWYIRGHYALIQSIGPWDIFIIVEGAVLLLLILIGMYVLFILHQKQLTLMKMQMHIISSVTHEFKTPLATTQLYLETMTKRDLPAETTNELVRVMLQENQRLKNLVEKFLESAKLSYKRRPYTKEPIAVKTFVETFIKDHENLLTNVSINYDIPDNIYINIDKAAFDMVFSNLAENAVHYSLHSPKIDIQVEQIKKKVRMSFSDHGIGIPHSREQDIFKIFQRLPEGVARWSSGTGIGLYVTREIIKAHGGKIWAKRKTEGDGTTFMITLPAAK